MTEALEPASERTQEEASAEDAADVRAAVAGDRRAFDRLVLRHQQAAIDAACYFLGSYEDGLEVAQEAFLKAYRGLARFRSDASFRTWLLRITLNTARSLRNRRRAKKRGGPPVSLDAPTRAGEGTRSGRLDVADAARDPAALLELREVKDALERAIAELDPEARALVVLRDIVGEPYDAIARELGLPLGTVKSKVHRARLELRRRLAPYL